MKRTHSFVKNLLFTFLLMLSLTTGFIFTKNTASAAVESWMLTAYTLPLNGSISGIASNNVAPTGMDPWWSYEDYFYFHVSDRQQITLSVSIVGTEPFEGVYLLDSNGKRLKELWKDSWTYSRSTNRSSISFTTTLSAGDYYIKQWDIYRNNERISYTTRVSAQPVVSVSQTSTNKVTVKKSNISRITKASKTSAKLTWKKASGVSGYQIYRSTSKNGTYKKIKTLSSKTTSFKNTGLKKKKTYYYKIRSYKKVNGRTYYSSFSSVKKIKM